MKLLGYKKIEGKIQLLSGLHIGGDKDKIEIGGIDSPVIRNPRTGLPYIPGSSIKGKMRFLLEWDLGLIDTNKGEPHKCGDDNCPVCRIFGCTVKDRKCGPTRIIINDCNIELSEDEKKQWEKGELNLFEDKVENRINRLTGTASDPRHIERVVEGARFKFNLTYKKFQLNYKDAGSDNQDEKNWQYVINALSLLQDDALGGSGSRGYGKIVFDDLKLNDTAFNLSYSKVD